MKQVTNESIQQRISDLTVGNVSLREEFELACLRQLVAVTEQVKQLAAERDAVVAENAALKLAFNPEVIPEDAVNAFMDTATIDHDWNDNGEWFWVENETDVIRAVLAELAVPETTATDSFLASLRAEGAANAIPVGYVLMPEQIHLDADAVECICSQGGDGGYNYGDFTDVILWVGEVESDDGSKTHGLNVSSADYPEDGAINLYEFAAQLRSQSAPSPEAAAIASQSEQVKGVQP